MENLQSDSIIADVSSALNKEINLSNVAIPFENNYGKFNGFLFGFQGDKTTYRLNFDYGTGSLSSFDCIYFHSPATPYYTVDLNGLSDDDVVNTIADNMMLSSTLYENIIREGRPAKDDNVAKNQINMWIDSEFDKVKTILQTVAMNDIYNTTWKKWWESQNFKPETWINNIKWGQLAKEVSIQRGIEISASEKRKKALGTDRDIVDKGVAYELEQLASKLPWTYSFDLLEDGLRDIFNRKKNFLVVYGPTGQGKTYNVLKVLQKLGMKEGTDYSYYKGGVLKTDEDVLRILYNNRDGKIIIFDDFDEVFKLLKPNVWKQILETDRIGVRDIITGNFEKKASATGKQAKNQIPIRFEFNSAVICLTNNIDTLDPAVYGRAEPIRMDFTNEQLVEIIEANLEDFAPEADLESKKIVLAFIKRFATGINNFSLRFFDQLIGFYQRYKGDAMWEAVSARYLADASKIGTKARKELK